GVGQFLREVLAIALQPEAQRMAIALLRVGEEQCEVVGDGLVDPLVAIGTPSDDVAPPLVSHFVNGDEVGEMLLGDVGKSDPMLSLGGQIGIGRKVQESWPALAERAGNLRDIQLLEREWSAEGFVKAYGSVDFAAELFEGVGRTRRRYGDLHHVAVVAAFAAKGGQPGEIGSVCRLEAAVDGLFE